MTLGELKAIVDLFTNDHFVFMEAFDSCHSYRGYYDQVAFGYGSEVPVGKVKAVFASAISDKFYGWKGGVYRYNSETPCNLAEEGMCADHDHIRFESLVGRMVIDYLTNNKGE